MKFSTLLPIFSYLVLLHSPFLSRAQSSMHNVYGRTTTDLNGNWKVVVDPFDIGLGNWSAIYKDKKPTGKKDFVEYSFDEGPTLSVPGDFNSQLPELTYFESSVWYKKTFDHVIDAKERLFVHFGAVNYVADVFFNGKKLGRHEGGFTPFQFEVTDLIKDKDNSLIVRANNARVKDGIPGIGFDWFNYGGITRDVHLIKTSNVFIDDYKFQLHPKETNRIIGYVQLSSEVANSTVELSIPELKIDEKLRTDSKGKALINLKAKLQLWTPENPKLYTVQLRVGEEAVVDKIGFRTIRVAGTQILLNGKPIFLRGVNIHEEIPQRRARAFSNADAQVLLSWAKELGCNFVRLAHYPHNEHTVRLAEEKGLLVWEEMPVYQGIDFADTTMKKKMDLMLREMIHRDKNRSNVILWSVANETYPSKERDQALIDLMAKARSLDDSRLITAAFNNVKYEDDKATLVDTVMQYADVLAVNEYMGWYKPWPKEAGKMTWTSPFNKPLIMSEFGGEGVFNNEDGVADVASTWSEEYLEQIYLDQLKMFRTIPFLQGTCPWILVDFRSPGRMHPKYQKGWNRKGLLSDRGDKKKAWFIMKAYYEERKKN